MPDNPGDTTSPKTVRELVHEARESFVYQLGTLNRWPVDPLERTVLLAAMNNAIVELVATLEETADELATTTRAHDAVALELAEIRTLSSRKVYSVIDPVCARCLALAAEVGHAISATPAVDGDTCSRCGGFVVQQRPTESEAQWRARFETHAAASRDGSTQDKG